MDDGLRPALRSCGRMAVAPRPHLVRQHPDIQVSELLRAADVCHEPRHQRPADDNGRQVHRRPRGTGRTVRQFGGRQERRHGNRKGNQHVENGTAGDHQPQRPDWRHNRRHHHTVAQRP